MSKEEIRNFLDNINKHTKQEIISNIPYIKSYLRNMSWYDAEEYLKRIFKIVDKKKVLYESLKDEKKFILWSKKLDIEDKLKYGVEIEVANLPLDAIQSVFKSRDIVYIMKILEVPTSIANKIINNTVFEKKDKPSKWIFSKEAGMDESEASSPIMQNNLNDLNEIVAVCTLLKAMNAQPSGETALHINVGVDYLECNEKAIDNILKIWGECEELFFKMANKEGEVIRPLALDNATPIKENIQDFLEGDGSVTLDTDEDLDRFLYQIQARNRMNNIVGWTRLGSKYDLSKARTDEEKYKIFQRHNQIQKKKGQLSDSNVRLTSINYNHMKWNSKNPGRVEIRIFNSSLDPEIIFEDLLLVAKLFEVSLKAAKNTNYKRKEFETLCKHDVTEEQKVNSLLDLLFDKTEQKRIYKRRWQSIKNKKEYEKYKSGRDTFSHFSY